MPNLDPQLIGHLADAAAGTGLDAAFEVIAGMLLRGESEESLLLFLVAPCARLLGEQWAADARPFAEVVRGLDVIREIANALSAT